ncbi:hypothetical protein DFH11DRAFT_1571376 [Phellopilus nigrolimitatus]|nr:hypothetical protein DFH11DRAFT_1571376 [Phellopilus nigrolimitatus]
MMQQHASSTHDWRFFHFFGRDGIQNQDTNVASQTMISSPLPPVHLPRKGGVVALGYGSLDDQAMRQLEGWSDNRPVIGSYMPSISNTRTG